MEGEDARTLWCGNLPDRATSELLEELFLQAGPLERVFIPKNKDGRQKNFAFIVYIHAESVPYAIDIFEGTCLFERPLNLQFRGGSKIDKGYSSRDTERDPYSRRTSPRRDEMLNLNSYQVQQFANAMSAQNTLSENMFRYPAPPGTDDIVFNRPSMNELSLASLTGQWSSKKLSNDRFEPYNRDSKFNRYKEMEYKSKHHDKVNSQKHYRDRNDDRHYKSREKNHRSYSRR